MDRPDRASELALQVNRSGGILAKGTLQVRSEALRHNQDKRSR